MLGEDVEGLGLSGFAVASITRAHSGSDVFVASGFICDLWRPGFGYRVATLAHSPHSSTQAHTVSGDFLADPCR